MNLFDNFERADGVNNLAGSTLSGSAVVWQKVDGVGTAGRGANAGILTGQAYFDTNPSGNTIIVANAGSNEGEVTYTYSEAIKETYYIFRYIDFNNYFYIYFNTVGVFARHVAAGVTTEFRGRLLALSDTYKVRITAAGVYSGFLNGAAGADFQNTDAALNAGTKHGFSTQTSTARIAEFSYTDTAPAVLNNAPVNTVPSTQNAGVNVAKSIAGISVTDANNNLATTKLTATGGTIYLSILGGATISAGASNSSTLTLSGTQAQINSALSTLGYIGTVLGTQTITVLSTDSAGTPLTDSDVINITVKDAYVVDNTAFKVTGELTNGVVLNSNGKWVIPTGATTWTFTAQKLSAEHTAAILLNLEGVTSSGGVSSGTVNPVNNVFITEAAYPLLTTQQRTDVETVGGGFPLFIVPKNIGDTTDAFDVQIATTANGTYTTYLSNQPFTPTAIVSGNIERVHPTFVINGESNMPASISVATKALLYTDKGQSEWFELSSLSTKSDENNLSSVRLIENSRTAIWDSPMPIALDIDEVGRIALLTSPVVGTAVLADGVQRFFKIIPKIIGGASVNPAAVTPIALTITSRSRRPWPVRQVIFTRNFPQFGKSFPESNIGDLGTDIYVYPSSRTETVTSGFFNPATAFEAGATIHVDVKTVGGETLIRTINVTNGTHGSYSKEQRASDIGRFATQYEVYTKKNGIESARFVYVVLQDIPFENNVTAVATPTFLTGNIRTAVTLSATAAAPAGTGQETGVYQMKLSGTLFPTVNMDAMSIDAGAATIDSYDKTSGELIVLAPRSLPNFVLIVPFTGTGTINVFAGKREAEGSDLGITSSATI